MRHLLSSNDLTTEYINLLVSKANEIIANPLKFARACNGLILASLFFEPSTRTRLSFESAMLRLGGSCLGFSDGATSSASKGESISDTIRVVSAYADICCMRHPKEGAAYLAADYSNVPVINAGDGGHQHPTQTLTDLLTISRAKGRLDNLTVGFCGDLKFGRTVHSLIQTMSKQKNRFLLVSPDELRLPDYIKHDLSRRAVEYEETDDLTKTIGQMDILYMTRVQRERFFNEEDYVRLKDTYILDCKKMSYAKDDMCVLHPLPRVNEIAKEVDGDHRALYFEQAESGRFIRMALIMDLLGVGNE